MSDSEKQSKEEIQRSFEEEVAATERSAPARDKKVKPDWAPIVVDMLILMAIATVLGLFSKLAMKPFEPSYKAQDLVALVRKGGLDTKTWRDEAFETYLQKHVKMDENFINCVDNTGRTPLMWMCYSNFNEPQHLSGSTKKYMKIPASVTDEKVLNETDLKRLYYTRKLLETPGIDVKAEDEDGFNAMHWAAWSGMPFHTLLLAQLGLDINETEGNGYTPLMLAALRGNHGAVSMLLQLGADPALRNKDGLTALDLAIHAGEAYKKRDSHFYKLIYSKEREQEYGEVLALLKNPPAVLLPEQLAQELQEVEQAYRGASARVTAEDAKK